MVTENTIILFSFSNLHDTKRVIVYSKSHMQRHEIHHTLIYFKGINFNLQDSKHQNIVFNFVKDALFKFMVHICISIS